MSAALSDVIFAIFHATRALLLDVAASVARNLLRVSARAVPFIHSAPHTWGHLAEEILASDWLSAIATGTKRHLLVVARYLRAKRSHVHQFFRCLHSGNM